MSERWEGYIDAIEGDTLFLRLFPPSGDEQIAEMDRAKFLAPVEPHEIREGLIFFWDIGDGWIKWSIPPRYTQEELDQADERAEKLAAFFKGTVA